MKYQEQTFLCSITKLKITKIKKNYQEFIQHLFKKKKLLSVYLLHYYLVIQESFILRLSTGVCWKSSKLSDGQTDRDIEIFSINLSYSVKSRLPVVKSSQLDSSCNCSVWLSQTVFQVSQLTLGVAKRVITYPTFD